MCVWDGQPFHVEMANRTGCNVNRSPGFFWGRSFVLDGFEVLKAFLDFRSEMALGNFRFFNLGERIRPDGEMFQVALLDKPEELPGEEVQAVNREVELLELR